jgi:hypothetical protein
MLRSIGIVLGLGVCCAMPVYGQPAPPSLEAYFTGKMVVVKVDMPGTEKGVDLDFEKPTPLDFKAYDSRLTSFGVAIHKGESAQITKIAIKSDHIEFQLNGGGYGTFGQNTDTNVSVKDVDKSAYEKDLEKQLKDTKDAKQRQQLQESLDKEVARRQRAEADAKAAAAVASQQKEAELANKRARGGSRFNLNFKKTIPPDDKNPDAVMHLLADYVDFSSAPPPPTEARAPYQQPLPGGAAGSSATQLQRGMKLIDVSNLLGKGTVVSHSTTSDGLQTQVIEFTTADSVVDTTFVEGVMVKYAISSK